MSAQASETPEPSNTTVKPKDGTVQLLQHLEGSATHGILGVGWLRAGPPKPKKRALVSRAVLEMLAKVSAELDAAQQEAESGDNPFLPKVLMPPELLEQRSKAKRQAAGGEWGILAKIKKLRDIARPDEKINNLEIGADGEVQIATVAMSIEEEEREEARQLEMERRRSARGTPSPGLDQAAADAEEVDGSGKKKRKKVPQRLLWQKLVKKKELGEEALQEEGVEQQQQTAQEPPAPDPAAPPPDSESAEASTSSSTSSRVPTPPPPPPPKDPSPPPPAAPTPPLRSLSKKITQQPQTPPQPSKPAATDKQRARRQSLTNVPPPAPAPRPPPPQRSTPSPFSSKGFALGTSAKPGGPASGPQKAAAAPVTSAPRVISMGLPSDLEDMSAGMISSGPQTLASLGVTKPKPVPRRRTSRLNTQPSQQDPVQQEPSLPAVEQEPDPAESELLPPVQEEQEVQGLQDAEEQQLEGGEGDAGECGEGYGDPEQEEEVDATAREAWGDIEQEQQDEEQEQAQDAEPQPWSTDHSKDEYVDALTEQLVSEEQVQVRAPVLPDPTLPGPSEPLPPVIPASLSTLGQAQPQPAADVSDTAAAAGEEEEDELRQLQAAVFGDGPSAGMRGGLMEWQLQLLSSETYEGDVNAPTRPPTPDGYVPTPLAELMMDDEGEEEEVEGQPQAMLQRQSDTPSMERTSLLRRASRSLSRSSSLLDAVLARVSSLGLAAELRPLTSDPSQSIEYEPLLDEEEDMQQGGWVQEEASQLPQDQVPIIVAREPVVPHWLMLSQQQGQQTQQEVSGVTPVLQVADPELRPAREAAAEEDWAATAAAAVDLATRRVAELGAFLASGSEGGEGGGKGHKHSRSAGPRSPLAHHPRPPPRLLVVPEDMVDTGSRDVSPALHVVQALVSSPHGHDPQQQQHGHDGSRHSASPTPSSGPHLASPMSPWLSPGAFLRRTRTPDPGLNLPWDTPPAQPPTTQHTSRGYHVQSSSHTSGTPGSPRVRRTAPGGSPSSSNRLPPATHSRHHHQATQSQPSTPVGTDTTTSLQTAPSPPRPGLQHKHTLAPAPTPSSAAWLLSELSKPTTPPATRLHLASVAAGGRVPGMALNAPPAPGPGPVPTGNPAVDIRARTRASLSRPPEPQRPWTSEPLLQRVLQDTALGTGASHHMAASGAQSAVVSRRGLGRPRTQGSVFQGDAGAAGSRPGLQPQDAALSTREYQQAGLEQVGQQQHVRGVPPGSSSAPSSRPGTVWGTPRAATAAVSTSTAMSSSAAAGPMSAATLAAISASLQGARAQVHHSGLQPPPRSPVSFTQTGEEAVVPTVEVLLAALRRLGPGSSSTPAGAPPHGSSTTTTTTIRPEKHAVLPTIAIAGLPPALAANLAGRLLNEGGIAPRGYRHDDPHSSLSTLAGHQAVSSAALLTEQAWQSFAMELTPRSAAAALQAQGSGDGAELEYRQQEGWRSGRSGVPAGGPGFSYTQHSVYTPDDSSCQSEAHTPRSQNPSACHAQFGSLADAQEAAALLAQQSREGSLGMRKTWAKLGMSAGPNMQPGTQAVRLVPLLPSSVQHSLLQLPVSEAVLPIREPPAPAGHCRWEQAPAVVKGLAVPSDAPPAVARVLVHKLGLMTAAAASDQ